MVVIQDAIGLPFEFFCDDCKRLLVEAKLNQFNVLCDAHDDGTPKLLRWIKKQIGGDACPYCGHKLRFPPVNVKVLPIPKEP